jgi:hypothetical protein
MNSTPSLDENSGHEQPCCSKSLVEPLPKRLKAGKKSLDETLGSDSNQLLMTSSDLKKTYKKRKTAMEVNITALNANKKAPKPIKLCDATSCRSHFETCKLSDCCAEGCEKLLHRSNICSVEFTEGHYVCHEHYRSSSITDYSGIEALEEVIGKIKQDYDVNSYSLVIDENNCLTKIWAFGLFFLEFSKGPLK